MKKIISGLMAMTLCLLAFTGCAGKEQIYTDAGYLAGQTQKSEAVEEDAKENENEIYDNEEKTEELSDYNRVTNHEVETEHDTEMTQENIPKEEIPYEKLSLNPFYGIWICASKDEKEVMEKSDEASLQQFDTDIMITSDWSDLNEEKYYALTLGLYPTQEEAEAMLPTVLEYYPDAYIKYSGTYRGGSSIQLQAVIYDLSQIRIQDTYAVLEAIIPDFADQIKLVVDDKTIFAQDCEMSVFGHYQDGMSVLAWMKAAYDARLADSNDFSIIGVYDVELTDNHIDRIKGLYWWD